MTEKRCLYCWFWSQADRYCILRNIGTMGTQYCNLWSSKYGKGAIE